MSAQPPHRACATSAYSPARRAARSITGYLPGRGNHCPKADGLCAATRRVNTPRTAIPSLSVKSVKSVVPTAVIRGSNCCNPWFQLLFLGLIPMKSQASTNSVLRSCPRSEKSKMRTQHNAAYAAPRSDFLYRFSDPAHYSQGNPPSIQQNWTTSTTDKLRERRLKPALRCFTFPSSKFVENELLQMFRLIRWPVMILCNYVR